ncbi:putative ribonuclease H-like domain-containing protein [Tanacetum coccineum]
MDLEEQAGMPDASCVRNKAMLVATGHDKRRALITNEHVYRVVKALYGLHQAPRAWYARLSTFLLQHNYRRGTIDKTLFIKKDSRDIILVQVYVDDIIFGSTNKAWCDEFETSTIKISTNVFDMESVRTATTPYEAAKTKLKDETDPPVNVHLYRSMIGSLMYLTASRPDIMFAVSACSRHQVTPSLDFSSEIRNPLQGGFPISGQNVNLMAFQEGRLCINTTSEFGISAGCTMVLLVVILPAGRMVSAGWSMVLLEVIVPAGFFVPAGRYGLCCCHLVSVLKMKYLAEILFRVRMYSSVLVVVVVDKLPDERLLTVPPSYCRDVVVAGSVIQTIQDGLRESYECLASAPIVPSQVSAVMVAARLATITAELLESRERV